MSFSIISLFIYFFTVDCGLCCSAKKNNLCYYILAHPWSGTTDWKDSSCFPASPPRQMMTLLGNILHRLFLPSDLQYKFSSLQENWKLEMIKIPPKLSMLSFVFGGLLLLSRFVITLIKMKYIHWHHWHPAAVVLVTFYSLLMKVFPIKKNKKLLSDVCRQQILCAQLPNKNNFKKSRLMYYCFIYCIFEALQYNFKATIFAMAVIQWLGVFFFQIEH